jgi:hypothetical protein
MRTSVIPLLCATAICVAEPPCQPYWTSVRGALPVVPSDSLIDSMVVFDDGGGPAIFIGGHSDPANPATYRVWRWRDGSMGPVGSLPPFINRRGPFVFDNGEGPRLAMWLRWFNPASEWRLFWWDGVEWTPDPQIVRSDNGLAFYTSFDDGNGSRIYGVLGPNFSSIHVVRWNGSGWTNLGPNFNNGLWLRVVDLGGGPELYGIGNFTAIGATPVSKVVKWNGSEWVSIGAMTQYIADLAAYDDGSGTKLYAMSNCCAYQIMLWRLEGNTWVPLGSPWSPPFTTYNMVGLQPFNDGPGQSGLYIVGSFQYLAPGVVSRGIARFNGEKWQQVGLGTGESGVRAVVTMHDRAGPSLFIAGGFTTMGDGGVVTRGLAQLVGCPNCYANCDLSTTAPTLNIADFSCFLQKFAKNDPYANCNLDATIDIADFACFLQKFAAGCP